MNIFLKNEGESQGDYIFQILQKVKEINVNKVYNTKELCKHLGVGRSVIDKLRQNGEISYSKVGQTIVFTQEDVDSYLERNKVKFVSWLFNF